MIVKRTFAHTANSSLSLSDAKMAHSSAANESLGDAMERMEPMLRNLETSLEITKKKLKEESRLRRQAEIAQVEMEARFDESGKDTPTLRDENESLREECDALQEELAFKCRELDDYKKEQTANLQRLEDLGNRVGSTLQKREERSGEASTRTDSAANNMETGSSRNRDSTIDDSYAEVLDELETVTEQLISTQQKLWKAEDKLRDSESHIRDLAAGRKRGQDDEEPGQTSLVDLMDEEPSTEAGTVSEAEKRLYAELSNVKDELAMASAELRAAEEQAESYQARLTTLENTETGQFQIKQLKEQAESYRARLATLEYTETLRAEGQSKIKHLKEQAESYKARLTTLEKTETLRAEGQSKIEQLKEQICQLKESSEMTREQVEHYEMLFEETKEENAGLVEEISCLREVLGDQAGHDTTDDTVVTDEQQKVETDLRDKITEEVRSTVL
jgi:chromosome segregation ATPase